ncbi:hypothetical protein BsWGS_09471 [Bradybaena similaris]
MDAGILQALKTVKSNPYVQYVGLGLAALIAQKDKQDPTTGGPLRKTKLELVRISAAVSGIELCYAAETAFVSPILLKLGVPTSLMTLTWCLSPFLGFFLVPVMGSLSDRCQSRFGRRRPFIVFMSIGIILGLALVPNGEALGLVLGDNPNKTSSLTDGVASSAQNNRTETFFNSTTTTSFSLPTGHMKGIIFTILGVAMLDFNCDACQSPCRAYLLDVTVPDDHPTGLTTFTVMAGAGGSIGYIMGGIDWNSTNFGEAFGGHIRVVFSIVLVAFIFCVISTLTSFKEIPLSQMNLTQDLQVSKVKVGKSKYRKFTNEDSSPDESENNEAAVLEKDTKCSYGALSGKGNVSSVSLNGAELYAHGKLPGLNDALFNRQSNTCSRMEAGITSGETYPKPTADSLILSTSLNTNFPTTHDPSKQLMNSCSQHQNNRVTSAALHNCIPHTLTDQEGLNGGHPSLFEQSNNQNSIPHPYEQPELSQKDSFKFRNVFSPEKNQTSDELNLYPKHNQVNSSIQSMDVVGRKVQVSTDVTLKTYLRSIVRMPRSMWTLCLCNLLCWMSLVCYSLYFTDFVGQSVFGGNPQAPIGSDLHKRYDAGVRLGSLGMSLYSLSCACYSLTIERLVKRFRAKRVYMLGQLVFTVGMAGMAVSRSEVAVILLSPTAGIMYATLFTMPYLLVAHYHTRGLFSQADDSADDMKQIRGLGTDVAIISSMVFLAQFLLSLMIGTLVVAMGSPVIVILASCVLSFLGSLTASQVTYLDL